MNQNILEVITLIGYNMNKKIKYTIKNRKNKQVTDVIYNAIDIVTGRSIQVINDIDWEVIDVQVINNNNG